jgi:hypothetical protein
MIGDVLRVQVPSGRFQGQRLVLEVWATRTDEDGAPYFLTYHPGTVTFHSVRPDWVLERIGTRYAKTQKGGATVLTYEELKDVLQGEADWAVDWAILTAQNPREGYRPHYTGEPNVALLQDLVTGDSEGFVNLRGVWHAPDGETYYEDSFLVVGLSTSEAVRLGRRYGQSAVITRDGLVNLTKGRPTVRPHAGFVRFGEAARRAPAEGAADGYGYSEIETLDRGLVTFAIGFKD